MARLVKEEEYTAKRNEILDAALALIYSKGYEQMAIQDILDQLKISRGAFYHYFDSKQSLLEDLIDRMAKETEQSLLSIVQDPDLLALEKFRRYFELSTRWKTSQKTLIGSLLRMWYADGNALFRQKMTAKSIRYISRIYESIIREGVEERVFTTEFPEQVAVIVAQVTLSISDAVIEVLRSQEPDRDPIQKAGMIMDAYTDSVERILGAPSGSLKVFEPGALEELFTAIRQESVPGNPGRKGSKKSPE
ncbi:TetR/AcrR family transcriptional regulator [Methanosphaerula palustris]|uniref:Transcriptional regulator, TetR family n=1 Tax=Methanosphaerula palustris (strain ATCC BAA-1556 / DSM 19958 / E1-9c) TaxID=521011 RepID=B8GH44_METPE|nr:TetR/AcrR family transcriptional regulator [Methanosphaerula palustris]ACL16449.1 transcriptional regulator, TetR family [Methanosphaerula palustris E1-9c]